MDPPEDEPVVSPQEDLVEDDEDEDGGSTPDPPLPRGPGRVLRVRGDGLQQQLDAYEENMESKNEY